MIVPALDALQRLQEGNRRFVSGTSMADAQARPSRRAELVSGQDPFAIVLGCSDSRVPAEIVFDCGLGDLFVIRVAGNIVAPSQIGSVEFAADLFQIRLVMVVGHSRCGAIKVTLDEIRNPNPAHSRNVRSIVDRIRPAVKGLILSGAATETDDIIDQAVRANVRVAAHQLRHGSEILERLVANEGLLVVGAEYSLETGVVDVFDGLPDQA